MLLKSVPYMEKAHRLIPRQGFAWDAENHFLQVEMSDKYQEVVEKWTPYNTE